MFHKKQKSDITVRDRMGRQRQSRVTERATPSAVFSYHANRSARSGSTGRVDPAVAATATVQRGKRTGMLRRTPVIVSSIAVLVLVIFNVVLTGPPQVKISAGAGAVPLRTPAAYSAAANGLFDASPFNKNKLTINTGRISHTLRAQFPELTRASVSVPFVGMVPVIHVTPSTPVLLLHVNAELYVIDASGRALLRANEVPNIEKLDLPVVTDGSGLAVSAGKPALPASDVSFITEVIGQLQAKGLTITSVTLPAGTSEMDVRISGVGYVGKFNLQGNGRVEAGAFLAVKAQLEREHIVPSQYIDVRVEERVYYK